MIMQRTLKNIIRATGVGLHTGAQVYLCLRPAPVDTGILFHRTDLDPAVEIPAHVNVAGATAHAITLERNGVRVSTVEHLLAALSGLGIDNAHVEVSAPEVPIMDGSAAPFVFLLESAGVVEQAAPRHFLRVLKPVEQVDGRVRAALLPHEGFKVTFEMESEHSAMACHCRRASVDFSTASFVREVARARTFGYLQDYDKLRSMDLVRGGSLDNAVLVNDEGVVNAGGLRHQDEFVKHKILDAMGDLSLLGCGLIGEFRGHGSGHDSHRALLRKLLASTDSWEIATCAADAGPVTYSTRPAVAGQA